MTLLALVTLLAATATFAIQRERVIADVARWSPASLLDAAARAWLRHRERGDLARLARGEVRR